MIAITRATKKESLEHEWRKVDVDHYGRPVTKWVEKKFRLKAVENGEIVGIVDGKVEAGTVYIETLIVAQSAQGRDIGTSLIKAAEQRGQKYGAHRTWLLTGKRWAENTFYKKLGFTQAGELADFYLHEDFVVYTRAI